MKNFIKIHRSANEIDRVCLEVSGILFDFGFPLENLEEEAPDIEDFKLRIKGLYKGETPEIKALFFAHDNTALFGLLDFIHPDIPIYLTRTMYNLLTKVMPLTSDFNPENWNLKVLENTIARPIKIGEIEVSVFEVDRNIIGAHGFEIKVNNQRIVYASDVRFHGMCFFKTKSFANRLKYADFLVIEGTTLLRSENEIILETEIMQEFREIFESNRLPLVQISPLNIDRFISFFKACLATRRVLIIDPYTCYVLEVFSKTLQDIPQFNSRNVRVHCVKNALTEKIFENRKCAKYRSRKITLDEIVKEPERYVIKGNQRINEYLLNRFDAKDLALVHSMLGQDFEDPDQFEDFEDMILDVHSTGQTYPSELESFIRNINPKNIIPTHSGCQAKLQDLFDRDVLVIEDGFSLDILNLTQNEVDQDIPPPLKKKKINYRKRKYKERNKKKGPTIINVGMP